jgi:hypothetical protein
LVATKSVAYLFAQAARLSNEKANLIAENQLIYKTAEFPEKVLPFQVQKIFFKK